MFFSIWFNLVCDSASTFFGAGFIQNQVKYSRFLKNGPELKSKLYPLQASSAGLRSLISSGNELHLNELVDKINRSFVIVTVFFLFPFLLLRKLHMFV